MARSEWSTEYKDISLDEEATLPLPAQWLRSMKISFGEGGDSSNKTEIVYRNTVSGLESEEHPFVVKALNAARKMELPVGWIVKEIVHIDGSKDYFYHNAEKGVSMWDPPMLRSCLANCILQEGFNPSEYGIVSHHEKESQIYGAERSKQSADLQRSVNINVNNTTFDRYNSDDDSNDDYSELFGDEEGELSSHQISHSPIKALPQRVPVIEIPKLSAGEVSKVAMLLKQKQSTTAPRGNRGGEIQAPITIIPSPPSNEENHLLERVDMSSTEVIEEQKEFVISLENVPHNYGENDDGDGDESVSSNEGAPISTPAVSQTRNWTEFLSQQRDKENEMVYSMVNRASSEGLPISIPTIRVLRSEVEESGERIHQLVMKLRSIMTGKTGLESSSYTHKSRHKDNNNRPLKSLITLGSDIVSSLRQNPRYILLAMKKMNQSGSSTMAYIAFITLHRLLHPFSTDNSMTAALLLQGFNSQLDELSVIEQSLNEQEYKIVIPRALFISDPEAAINWNPLNGPMPLVPMIYAETSLTCLLRIFAVRRDVTSYFRSIWKPLLPAVLAVLNVDDDTNNASTAGPHVFSNLMSVAHRLLLCALRERSARSLPATVVAVCQTVFDIGGFEALCNYIFNLLVLPNLLKILAGDHESTENEEVYRVDDVVTITNKYFDHLFWCEMDSGQSFSPFPSLLWIIWRLFTYASNVEHVSLSSLTTKAFVGSRFKFKSKSLDISGVVDAKLRNIIAKLYRVISRYCDTVLSIPLSMAPNSKNSNLTQRYVSEISKSSHQQMDDDTTIRSEATSRTSSMHSYSRPNRTPNPVPTPNRNRNHNPVSSIPSAALSLAAEFKPSELLNRTVVSRYELRSLFSAVGQTIEEEVEKSGPSASIYQAISEYLLFDNRESMRKPEVDDNYEQFMQLQFLYSNSIATSPPASSEDGSFEPGDASYEKDEVFESQGDMAARHEQLLRGLKLAHKYEDSLMKMISRAETNETNDLYDLVCNESWQQLTDFNANFKQNSLNAIQKRHTVGSSKRIKQTNFGLQEPKEIELFPTSSKKGGSASRRDRQPDAGPPDFKSLKELQKEVIDSYRFGSSSSCVAVGTSMARSMTVPSKLSPNNRRQKKPDNVSRSRYTTFDDKIAKSAFLAPTESVLNGRNANPTHHPTPREMEKRFVHQLRSYDEHQQPHEEEEKLAIGWKGQGDVPTNQRRRKGRSTQPKATNHYESATAAVNNIAKPFPEHLRHRVRKVAGEDDNLPSYFRPNDTTSRSFQELNSEEYQNMSTTSSAYEYKNDYYNNSSFQSDNDRNNLANHYYHSNQPMGDEDENYFTRDEDENDNRKVRRIGQSDERGTSSVSDEFIASILSDYKKLRLHSDQKGFTDAISTTQTDSNISRINNISVDPNTSTIGGAINSGGSIMPTRNMYSAATDSNSYNKTVINTDSNRTVRGNAYSNTNINSTIATNTATNSNSTNILSTTAPTTTISGTTTTAVVAPTISALNTAPVPTPIVRVDFSGNPAEKSKENINNKTKCTKEAATTAQQEFSELDEKAHKKNTTQATKGTKESNKIVTNVEVRSAQQPLPVPKDTAATKKPAPSQHAYSLNLESLTANTALSRDNYIVDLNADRARNMKLRTDRLRNREGQGELEEDPTYTRTITNNASPLTGTRGGGTDGGRRGSSPGKSAPAVIRRKSVVLSKNESLDVLNKGFTATKYGRSGSRKKKMVIYNEAKGTLEWRPFEEDTPHSFSLRRQISGLFSRASPSTPSAATPGNKEDVKSIFMDSIVEVRRGIQSELLQKAGLVDPNCCLSIIHTTYSTPSSSSSSSSSENTRSLDLELSSSVQRDGIIRGLQSLHSSEGSTMSRRVKFL